MNKELTRLTESAILVALAVVLEIISKMIPVLQMPQGGSASLAMFPIFILSYRHGLKWGLLAGFAFGIVNFFIDGYAFFWGSFVFDYTLGFAAIGLAGFFSKKALKLDLSAVIFGVLLGGFTRFVIHTLSGIFFFAEYAGDENVIIYSIVYNGTYMLASTILCLVAMLLTYKRLLVLNRV
ncbi:energy-coupled thiamine transporter ThiT [Acholeplasma vituli]|uniref:Energy-coupled thiamine transporter ThiT n=1 Tax=Paracholeplasma vituli TaxID=69473 RepID=A0ABT2PV51_9MOLU|nr:energy-coupled thiamine transporter ThiT [Paracholeplasma vituli]MCU0104829.1 energy-coupled thiamine transporter ThiT [Paracholeplasma vituli]